MPAVIPSAAAARPAAHVTGIAAGPEPRLPSLEQALAYRNDQILYKFQERFDVSFEEADELFEETKKWLWLQVAARKRGGPPFVMTVSMAMVDEMLHTFILFTREYIGYCDDNYGVYLHHTPMTKAQKDTRLAQFKRERQQMLAEEAAFLARMYAFVYDTLGEPTLLRWYSDYARKYAGPRMAELAKAAGRRFASVDVDAVIDSLQEATA